jgi:hypothetical protein
MYLWKNRFPFSFAHIVTIKFNTNQHKYVKKNMNTQHVVLISNLLFNVSVIRYLFQKHSKSVVHIRESKHFC